MKDFLKGLGIIILVMAVLVLAVPRLVHLIKYAREVDGPEGYYVSKEMLEEQYDAMDSDIEGWTMGDKFRAGLQPIEGSDSDGDGLTDKEEIEVYGSNPLKTSTADDLYTDGDKVRNGLDFNTYYEREDVSFDNNDCAEVELSAATVGDIFAHVGEERIPNIDGYTVYKAYDIYSYGNDLKIDVSDICKDNGVVAEDLTILIGHWYGGKMWTSKTSVDGNIVSVTTNLDNNQRYTMLVAKKDGFLSSSKPMYNAVSAGSEDFRVDANFLYVLTFGFRNLFVDTKPHLYYVPTGDVDKDNETVGYLLALSHYVVDGIHLGLLTDEDVKPISEVQMKAMKSFLSAYSDFELTEENPKTSFKHFFLVFNQTIILDPEKYKAVVENPTEWANTSTSMTGFHVSRDSFPFTNFSSKYSLGGNCAGIAYHTAQIFNNRTAKASGEYSSDRYENGTTSLSWDISNDMENDTLTDFELGDYKTMFFNYERKGKDGLLSAQSDGEEEFFKMIAAYWAEENDHALAEPSYYITENIGTYNWSMIEDIEHYLDQGKILILCMRNSDSNGHAMNIVGYRTEDDGDSVYFELYDSNFPFNTHKGNKIKNVLEIKRKSYSEGCKDSFSYYYKPYNDCPYEYNSEYNIDGIKCFSVNDTEFNFFH